MPIIYDQNGQVLFSTNNPGVVDVSDRPARELGEVTVPNLDVAMSDVIDQGVATSGTSTTLTDSAKNFEAGIIVDTTVQITVGTVEYYREVTSCTGNVLGFATLGDAVSATAVVGEAAAGQVTVTVAAEGVAGNSYQIELVNGVGVDQPVSAALVGSMLTVTLGTDVNGDPDPAKNIGMAVRDAVDALPEFTAAMTGAGGQIGPTVEPVQFAGGLDAVEVGAGTVYRIRKKEAVQNVDVTISALRDAITGAEGAAKTLADLATLLTGVATEAKQDALIAKDFATEAKLEAVRALLAGTINTQLSGSNVPDSAGVATKKVAKVSATIILNAVSVVAGASTPDTVMGVDGTESEVWLSVNIDKQPWTLLAHNYFGNISNSATYPQYSSHLTAYASSAVPALALCLGMNCTAQGFALPTTVTSAKDQAMPLSSTAACRISNGHATDNATITVKVIRIWR